MINSKLFPVIENTYIDNDLVMATKEMWTIFQYHERIDELNEKGFIISLSRGKDNNERIINIWF